VNRRQFLGLAGAASLGGLAGCSFNRAVESPVADRVTVGLEPVVEGLTFPTSMVVLPDGSHLVSERGGQIRQFTDSGLREDPFLALGDRLAGPVGEQGLLGLALHPDFADNHRLYARYSAPPEPGASGSHRELLSEFEVRADLQGIREGSERRILSVPQPGPMHNAGDLAFGPDGLLYVPFGDGQRTTGGGGDGLWWYDQGEAAQNTRANLRGGLLRIDVDDTSGEREYGIPADNPLVGTPGRDEYWAWGLRNPYRISFDGDRLFVADVGEHIRESVYLGEAGANYGWPMLEGSTCGASTSIGHELADNPLDALNPKTWVALTNRISPVKVCPATDVAEGPIRDPVVEYTRPGGRAITGGYVYHGDEIPALEGKYVFGDHIAPAPLFAADPAAEERPWPLTDLRVAGSDDGRLSELLVSFARDPDGGVSLLTTQGGQGTGRIRRLTAPA